MQATKSAGTCRNTWRGQRPVWIQNPRTALAHEPARMKANWNTLHRLWMLLAQAVTVGAGLLIAWHAFGPAAPPPARNDVVTIREATTSPSLASTILGRRDTG